MAVETLIETYTGSAWNIVSSPNPSPDPYTGPNGLFTVSCLTTTDCWAVGANAESLALIEQYTGSGWTIPASPIGGDSLQGVACPSTDDCWAVGSDIGHYNGTGWAITTAWSGEPWWIPHTRWTSFSGQVRSSALPSGGSSSVERPWNICAVLAP
jgi:hypothetical protein